MKQGEVVEAESTKGIGIKFRIEVESIVNGVGRDEEGESAMGMGSYMVWNKLLMLVHSNWQLLNWNWFQ